VVDENVLDADADELEDDEDAFEDDVCDGVVAVGVLNMMTEMPRFFSFLSLVLLLSIHPDLWISSFLQVTAPVTYLPFPQLKGFGSYFFFLLPVQLWKSHPGV